MTGGHRRRLQAGSPTIVVQPGRGVALFWSPAPGASVKSGVGELAVRFVALPESDKKLITN